MALASRKLSKKLLKDRSGTGEIDENRITRASASFADDKFTEDPNVVDSLGPILYHADLMDEDIDELRRYITNDITSTDNNYTTAEKTKLAGIETGADVTDFTNVQQALTSATDIGTPASTDRVLVQDASDSNKMKYAAFSQFGGSGGGGGLTETPLIAMSGRAQWSSTDSGELVHIGGSYGPVSFYSHTGEPNNATLRAFDSRQTIDTTSIRSAFAAYNFASYGIYVPDESKKVKLRATWRLQNAPASSTWGWSIWSADQPTTATGNSDAVLRARSSDVTYGNSSIATYFTTTTTTSAMNDTYIFPVLENRTGTLTTNTYAYFMLQLFLV